MKAQPSDAFEQNNIMLSYFMILATSHYLWLSLLFFFFRRLLQPHSVIYFKLVIVFILSLKQSSSVSDVKKKTK